MMLRISWINLGVSLIVFQILFQSSLLTTYVSDSLVTKKCTTNSRKYFFTMGLSDHIVTTLTRKDPAPSWELTSQEDVSVIRNGNNGLCFVLMYLNIKITDKSYSMVPIEDLKVLRFV